MSLWKRSGGHLQEEPPAWSDDSQNKKPRENDEHSVVEPPWHDAQREQASVIIEQVIGLQEHDGA